MIPPTDDELGRRLAAARGYKRETASQFAERLGRHRGTLADYERGKFPDDLTRRGLVGSYVELTGLPEAFFRIDFKRLPEMAEAWRQVHPESAEQEAERTRRSLEEEAENGHRPDDPNGSQPER